MDFFNPNMAQPQEAVKPPYTQFPSDLPIVAEIEIQNLVKAGKISLEAAHAYAEKFGLIPTKDVDLDRSMSVSKTKEVFNFSVYKWNRIRTVQRLILQFDFKTHTLSDIQQGRRAEKIKFKDILSYQSEDGLRLLIQFASHGQYELDANTLDEKNKMIRLLSSILQHYQKGYPVMLDDKELLPAETFEDTSYGPLESAAPVSPVLVPVSPPVEPQPSLIPPNILTPSYIKEGMVEKRGHSAAFLMWPKRYLKVCDGELLYYKPEDKEQAINIIPLKADVTRVKKIDSHQFTVSLMSSKKTFSFRTIGSEMGKTAQQERDEWVEAIYSGCHSRHKSDARLRRGTITAKQQMNEMKIKRQSQILPVKPNTVNEDPFENLSSGEFSQELEKKPNRERPRSRTVSFTQQTLKRLLGKTFSPDSPTSSFYVPPTTQDVTTPYTTAVEMENLKLWDRSYFELLELLKSEYETLASVLLPSTTGTALIDMIVARMGSIISALRQDITSNTHFSTTSDSDNKPTSPSTTASTMLTERVVDGRSDEAEIASPDLFDKIEDSLSASSTSSVSLPPITSPSSAQNDHFQNGKDVSSKTMNLESPSDSSMPTTALYLPEKDSDENCSNFPALSQQPAPLLPPVQTQSEATVVPGSPSRTHYAGVPEPPPSFSSPGVPEPPPSLSSPGVPEVSPPPGVPEAPPPPGVPGIPPPPPPPMFGVPGAPPLPPPFGQFFLPALPMRQPTKKLKRFHITPLAIPAVQTSDWMHWAKKGVTKELDFSELENLFSAEADDKKKPAPATGNKKVSLLDHNRSRNIEIFLPSFPLSLQSLDTELNDQLNIIEGVTKLSIEHIVALKRFQPSDEEKEMYKKFAGDKNLLPIADTFLLKLGEVPMLSMRLDLLFTLREFPVNMKDFQPTLQLAWMACHELNQSQQFVEVLQYVLAIANYLNAGTNKGNAYGFKLDCLPKLAEVKGFERTTLLEFLVQQLQSKQPELLNMPESLESVAKASEISITSILAELEVMGSELDKIEKSGNVVANHPRIPKEIGIQLQKEVKRFVVKYRAIVAELDAKGQEMSTTYTNLLIKFGEPSTLDSEDFFSTIAKFLIHFKKICSERLPRQRPSRVVAKDVPTVDAPSTSTIQEPKTTPSLKPKFMKSLTLGVIEENKKMLGPESSNTLGIQHRGGTRRVSRKLEPKQDYLEKKSSDGRWAKRYFELEQGKLHYYGSKGHDYRHTINIRGVPVRLVQNDLRIIEIESENRMYQLKAKNTDSASAWLKALQNHGLS